MLKKSSFGHFFNIDYMNENESCASTNKDSNMTSSIKGNNYYNFFRNNNCFKSKYEDNEKKENATNINNIRIHSYLSNIVNKEKTNGNNKNSSRMKYNYYPKAYSNFNNYNKQNSIKTSLINKTMNVLKLKKGTINQKKPKYDFNNYFSFRHNQKNQRKVHEKKKINEKINRTQPIIKNKNNIFSKKAVVNDDNKKNSDNKNNNKNKCDFNYEKKKLILIKKQYIKNIKNAQILFHDIKSKMSNISEFQKNILELNNKCLKYTSLSQEDNLKKYREENKRNLNEYALKNKQLAKRPFSCDDYNNKKTNPKKVKQKILKAEIINKRDKRVNKIKEKLDKIKDYNNIKSKCYNSLRFHNEILSKNEGKKLNFYNKLKQKINDIKNKKKYFSQNISGNIKI